MLQRLADLFVLRPSRHEVDSPKKMRFWIETERGRLEIWRHWVGAAPSGHATTPEESADAADALVLKFSGAAGRAERSTDHPADSWDKGVTEIWSVNPPGYGGSSGRATLPQMAAAAHAAFDAMERAAAGRPLFIAGNSLGAAYALHLAASRSFDGLIVRNPPPLRQLIRGRFGPCSLWLGAELIARHTPKELDSIANAALATMPAVFLLSQKDRVVPPYYQRQIVEAYQGDKRVVRLANADHACPLQEEEQQYYAEQLRWLRSQANVSPLFLLFWCICDFSGWAG